MFLWVASVEIDGRDYNDDDTRSESDSEESESLPENYEPCSA